MAIQSFFRQRSPRRFDHKPIYWDARAEELDKRVERIKQELIESGELDPSEASKPTEGDAEGEELQPTSPARTRLSRGAFSGQTEHLRRQQEQGISSDDRSRRMIRLMISLLVLGFVLWFFFLK